MAISQLGWMLNSQTLFHNYPQYCGSRISCGFYLSRSTSEGTTILATCKGNIVGTCKQINTGKAVFLGFRPRDNQSESLGKETRWLFDILSAMNAYPVSGTFQDYNDNPDYLSRNTPYMFPRFPNGTIAVAPHYKIFKNVGKVASHATMKGRAVIKELIKTEFY
jgi:hypothetical protein